jgi:hypothetical protein
MNSLLRKLFVLVLTVAVLSTATAQQTNTIKSEMTSYLIVRSKITIDRSVEVVWPYFLDMNAWMAENRLQTIYGSRGQEGEIQLVTPRENGAFDPYTVTTVRVTPREQYVVRVLTKKATVYSGFADFSFTEAEGRTHLTYDIYVESIVPMVSDDESKRISKEQHKNASEVVSRSLQNLKSLVESKE